MRIFKNKKASLELSIRTIVIVVLAMTLLGLGLGFIRGMFASITETTFTVQEQIKQQILEDLRTGDKKLSFPTSEVKIGKKASTILAIGIKNTGENTKYHFISLTDISSGNPITSNSPVTDVGTFIWDIGAQPLEVNEANVYPIKFTSESTSGTTIVKITIEQADTETGTKSVYATKSFFITVT